MAGALFVGFTAVIASTVLQAAPSAAQRVHVMRAIEIFTDSCAIYIGQSAPLRAHLAKSYEKLPLASQKIFLGNEAGEVWGATDGRGRFVVVSHDDGKCTVLADDIDVDVMRGAFHDMMTTIGKNPAVTVKLGNDIVSPGPKGQVFTLAYSVTNQKSRDLGAAFMLTTLPTEQGSQLARLTTSIVRTTK